MWPGWDQAHKDKQKQQRCLEWQWPDRVSFPTLLSIGLELWFRPPQSPAFSSSVSSRVSEY